MVTYLVTTIVVLLAVSQSIDAAKLSETQGKISETESGDNSKKGMKGYLFVMAQYNPFIL